MTDRDSWKFSGKISGDRLALLMNPPPFEQIVNRLVSSCSIASYEVTPGRKQEVVGARQAEFRIEVAPEQREIVDLFFNSSEGIRAQYFRSPDIGDEKNDYVIHELAPKLLEAAETYPASYMTLDDVSTSLNSRSKKIWIAEDDNAQWTFNALLVERWVEAANKGINNAMRGTAAVANDALEVKGAFIELGTNTERIPFDKLKRSEEIFNYGYS